MKRIEIIVCETDGKSTINATVEGMSAYEVIAVLETFKIQVITNQTVNYNERKEEG